MKTHEKLLLVFFFSIGFLLFWFLTGYQSNWDSESLRRMAVLRYGFAFTIGCVFDVCYCLYKVLTT